MRASLTLLVAGGVAAASGRVVRVEQAPSREVFVPAGTFWMGVNEKQADAAERECHAAFEQEHSEGVVQFRTPNGIERTMCERYAPYIERERSRLRDVEHERPRMSDRS